MIDTLCLNVGEGGRALANNEYISGLDARSGALNGGSLDHIFQLSDVSRKIMCHELLDSTVG